MLRRCSLPLFTLLVACHLPPPARPRGTPPGLFGQLELLLPENFTTVEPNEYDRSSMEAWADMMFADHEPLPLWNSKLGSKEYFRRLLGMPGNQTSPGAPPPPPPASTAAAHSARPNIKKTPGQFHRHPYIL